MKFNRLPIALLFAMVAPVSQAAVISIGDPLSGVDTDETITLLINNPFAVTPPGGPPGTGTVVTAANAASLNFAAPSFSCGPGPEQTCSFTFNNQIPWSADVYFYRYLTESPSGLSDLFVIQGLASTRPDVVTFLSSDTLTGNILTDGPAAISNATPINIGTVQETGDWQLAVSTGVDQYYIKSVPEPVPEPATLALLGLGLAGLGFSRRKQ